MKIIREGKYISVAEDIDGDLCLLLDTDKGGHVRLDCKSEYGIWTVYYSVNECLSASATAVG